LVKWGACRGAGDEVVESNALKPCTVIAAMMLAAAVVLSAAPAAACNCPKEQMIKKYGTVSQVRPPMPLPPPLPTSKAAVPTIIGG